MTLHEIITSLMRHPRSSDQTLRSLELHTAKPAFSVMVDCDRCSPDHYLGAGYLPGSADLPCICRLRGTPGKRQVGA